MKSTDSASSVLVLANDHDISSDPSIGRSHNDYAELKRIIKKNGLLEKQPLYYTYKITLTLSMLVASVIFFLLVNNFWLQLLNAVFLAFVATQIGFLGHDAGHRQIFHTTRKNNLLTLLMGNVLIGMSKNWWLDKHNSHHSHPNQVDLDPDIDIAVIALTEEEALNKKSYQRFIVKYQAYFFLPLLMLVGLELRVNSIRFLLRNKGKALLTEGSLLLVHYALFIGLLLCRLNVWQALLFLLVNQLLFGFFLGSAFAPNHKGMPILDKESQVSFLQRQILTARNVNSGLFNDFWYGGLNYQIEHHLFPSMPRNRLKEAQLIVKDYCQSHAITYSEVSMLQSYREIMSFLHHVSASLRMATV